MKRVGFIGIRGMVGQVLLSRMREENDFNLMLPTFFSSTQVNLKDPLGRDLYQDAFDLEKLMSMDILVATQGSEYTQKVYPQLRQKNWQGYWIDAASHLRLASDSHIPIEPINLDFTLKAIERGTKTFVGANCTVSIMLLGLAGIIKNDPALLESVSFMSYQAISGAGAQALEDYLHKADSPMRHNVMPWIDTLMPGPLGQTREEWKAEVEGNKILGHPQFRSEAIAMDGLCVRVGVLRSHSLGLQLQLKKSISTSALEELICQTHPYLHWVPNQQELTQKQLNPQFVSETLKIAVGRCRPSSLNANSHYLFVTGDQLLWGASEPLRRVLRTLLQNA